MIVRTWPLILAYMLTFLFEGNDFSYFLASWICSLFILFFTLFGNIFPNERVLDYPMRPVVTTNIIFSFYMSMTSIFYFLDINGYYYLSQKPIQYIDIEQIRLSAICQNYYVLAQLFFTLGLVLGHQKVDFPKFKLVFDNIPVLSFRVCLVFSGLGFVAALLPGLSQFAVLFGQLSLVASVLSLALAIPEKNKYITAFSLTLFLANEAKAVVSGWKEAILVPFILLGIFLFPYYKKTILIFGSIFILLFLYFIPTYNQTVRNLSWGEGDSDRETASKAALEGFQNTSEDEISSTNWDFLTGRLSEIAMFTKYVSEVPEKHDYYEFKIIEQAFISIIPRIFYPEKPITETLVMQRTIELNVISEYSVVSAKPQVVVDAYLTYGGIGVIFTFLFLGFIGSKACAISENLFGGYLFGCCLMYTGLFLILWRGNCFEFLFNSIFWGIIIMYMLFNVGLYLGILKDAKK